MSRCPHPRLSDITTKLSVIANSGNDGNRQEKLPGRRAQLRPTRGGGLWRERCRAIILTLDRCSSSARGEMCGIFEIFSYSLNCRGFIGEEFKSYSDRSFRTVYVNIQRTQLDAAA